MGWGWEDGRVRSDLELVELSLLGSPPLGGVTWDPDIVTNLEADLEGDLGDVLLSLFRQRPGAIPKLEQ